MSSGYSDEDFDAYEDDFEPEEDYEVLPKSMARPTSPPAPPAKPTTPPHAQPRQSPPKNQHSGFYVMDLPQTPLLSDTELRARNQRLLRSLQKMKLIQLQAVAMDDVFVLATLSEYDLYCMARGPYAGCKVCATQTNDDAKDQENQTEEIMYRHFGSQVPDDRNKMTEAEVFAFSVDTGGSKSRSKSTSGAQSTPARVLTQDPALDLKLASFMQWAGPMMLASLGMGAEGGGTVSFGAQTGGAALSGGLLHLSGGELLAHRPVTSLALCEAPGQAQLLVAYAPVGAQLGPAQLIKDHGVSGKGCLCVWDLVTPQRPRAVCVSEGTPTCCAWAPYPAHHVFVAGMEEGGVCAWDLQEPASRHPVEKVGNEQVVLRRPAFTSEAQAEPGSATPICDIVCVAKAGTTPGLADRNSPCTVLALGAWGEVTVFSLSIAAGSDASASDTDLGVRIGSRVRLLRGAATVRLGLNALQPHIAPAPGPPCHCLGVLQGVTGPSAQLLVGAEGAKTLRGSWLGMSPAPKQFLSVDAKSEAAVSSQAQRRLGAAVTCLDVSPACPQAFLVGLSDGGLALHSCEQTTAVLEWPCVGEGRMVSVRWLPGRPTCFLALDAACQVLFFDLSKDLHGPVQRQPCMVQTDAGPALTTRLTTAAVQPQGKAGQPLPCFALGYDDGSVDVHQVAATYASGSAGVGGEAMVLRRLLGVPDVAQ